MSDSEEESYDGSEYSFSNPDDYEITLTALPYTGESVIPEGIKSLNPPSLDDPEHLANFMLKAMHMFACHEYMNLPFIKVGVLGANDQITFDTDSRDGILWLKVYPNPDADLVAQLPIGNCPKCFSTGVIYSRCRFCQVETKVMIVPTSYDVFPNNPFFLSHAMKKPCDIPTTVEQALKWNREVNTHLNVKPYQISPEEYSIKGGFDPNILPYKLDDVSEPVKSQWLLESQVEPQPDYMYLDFTHRHYEENPSEDCFQLNRVQRDQVEP